MPPTRRRTLRIGHDGDPVSSEDEPGPKKRRRSQSKASRAHYKATKRAFNGQMDAAIAYCNQHNVTAWEAIKTGKFPLIEDYRRLKRKVDNGGSSEVHGKTQCILTHVEEHQLVNFVLNKNRAFHWW